VGHPQNRPRTTAPEVFRKLCGISWTHIECRKQPFGQQLICDAAPPAARMAHLKMIARRGLGSSHATAVNKKAPMMLIAKTYTTARTAVIGGDANVIKYRALCGHKSK
jgi:hypothetical protein